MTLYDLIFSRQIKNF